MNPLYQKPQVNSPINMLRGMQNPKQFAEQLLRTNPQAQQFLAQAQQMAQGKNPKDVAKQLAKQYGISEQELMSFASQMGLK
ncbi:MAG: hypothetical protein IJ981_03070 [Clostridia bacterium]|nr:hypothetical protein [Clostridia bacterium]